MWVMIKFKNLPLYPYIFIISNKIVHDLLLFKKYFLNCLCLMYLPNIYISSRSYIAQLYDHENDYVEFHAFFLCYSGGNLLPV